ncbi:uncharacterized protein [Anabrus simplex]|uniref:uncharacterized protein n=1 Tax=Anabrus simplex TaxID=316456 RepID=UPI0034DD7CB4
MESNNVLAELMLLHTSLALLLGAVYLKRRNRQRRRRWWVHPLNQRRLSQGDFGNLLQEMRENDPHEFFLYMRMKPEQFDTILNLVSPFLIKRSVRSPLPTSMRLAITLRFLATGDSIPSLAWNYRIGKSTACQVINETTRAIWDALHGTYLPLPTEEDFRRIAQEFYTQWDMPNCIGAIDGKHIVIQAPSNSGSQFFNYKKTFSTVLMAVCDANYRFTYVDIGAYGSQSDGGIFRQSDFGHRLYDGLLPIPNSHPFPNSTNPMPYYFVGDEAFPLKRNLMRPFSKASLNSLKTKVFNYRLSRARRVIENAFGILVSRWRIFHRNINAKPENVDNITKATVCLHNFLTVSEMNSPAKLYCPSGYADKEMDGQVQDGDWRMNIPGNMGALQRLRGNRQRVGARNATFEAQDVRNKIADYLVSPAGAIDGQIEYILRGSLLAD